MLGHVQFESVLTNVEGIVTTDFKKILSTSQKNTQYKRHGENQYISIVPYLRSCILIHTFANSLIPQCTHIVCYRGLYILEIKNSEAMKTREKLKKEMEMLDLLNTNIITPYTVIKKKTCIPTNSQCHQIAPVQRKVIVAHHRQGT